MLELGNARRARDTHQMGASRRAVTIPQLLWESRESNRRLEREARETDIRDDIEVDCVSNKGLVNKLQ